VTLDEVVERKFNRLAMPGDRVKITFAAVWRTVWRMA
jgi:hypothetical protein